MKLNKNNEIRKSEIVKTIKQKEQQMETKEKIEFLKSSMFAYARYKRHYEDWAKKEWGDGYYTIYRKDNSSPTGVFSLFSCTISEWDEWSLLTGKKNQYLAPNEKW